MVIIYAGRCHPVLVHVQGDRASLNPSCVTLDEFFKCLFSHLVIQNMNGSSTYLLRWFCVCKLIHVKCLQIHVWHMVAKNDSFHCY